MSTSRSPRTLADNWIRVGLFALPTDGVLTPPRHAEASAGPGEQPEDLGQFVTNVVGAVLATFETFALVRSSRQAERRPWRWPEWRSPDGANPTSGRYAS